MDMNCIRMVVRVTVHECIKEGNQISLKVDDGTMLRYVGGYDFNQVKDRTLNRTVVLGIDPSMTYCALTEDVARHQLR